MQQEHLCIDAMGLPRAGKEPCAYIDCPVRERRRRKKILADHANLREMFTDEERESWNTRRCKTCDRCTCASEQMDCCGLCFNCYEALHLREPWWLQLLRWLVA